MPSGRNELPDWCRRRAIVRRIVLHGLDRDQPDLLRVGLRQRRGLARATQPPSPPLQSVRSNPARTSERGRCRSAALELANQLGPFLRAAPTHATVLPGSAAAGQKVLGGTGTPLLRLLLLGA